MKKWYMLNLVGKDRRGIVAHVAAALFDAGCNLGEASMMRLGGNFSIMMMVEFEGTAKQLRDVVEPVADSMGLHYHVDRIEGRLHNHVAPDVRITVYGADRAGIVAKVTGALAEAGLDILDLESDIAGSSEAPVYILQIAGVSSLAVEQVEQALAPLREQGVSVNVSPIETYIG